MSRTIYAAKFEQTIIHWLKHVHLRESQSHEPARVLIRLYPFDKSLVCLQYMLNPTSYRNMSNFRQLVYINNVKTVHIDCVEYTYINRSHIERNRNDDLVIDLYWFIVV
jgi:hypothetical protein